MEKHKSVYKVANIVGCNPHRIYDAIYHNRISYPINYKNTRYSPVVQLDMNMNYIMTYVTISEAERCTNVNGISKALNKNRSYCGGYYWVYEQEYISEISTIVKTRLKKIA